MYEKKDWKFSEFNKFVRVKEEDWNFLKRNKGKKTMAGKLCEIIEFYKNAKPTGKIKQIPDTGKNKNNQ